MSETATKPQVKVSDVLELLNQGKDRKEIAEHYGIPVSVMARTVWQHPKLKNKKAKKQYDIVIEDDTVDPAQTTLEQLIAEVETEGIAEANAAEAVVEEVATQENVEATSETVEEEAQDMTNNPWSNPIEESEEAPSEEEQQ